MKDFKYYEEKAKKELIDALKEGLKREPVRISIDTELKSIEDMDKTSHRHAIKRLWRKNARVSMEKAKKPSLRMIQPITGSNFNGIKLDEGIVLPVFAPEILETKELTEQHMIMGLFLILQQKFDEYYVKLLRSFEIDKSIIVPELLEMLESDKYWKKRKIYKK